MNIAFTATLSDRVIDRDTLPPPPRTFTAGVSGFSYEDLRDVAQLPRLMDAFDDFARAQIDPALWQRFVAYRQHGGEGTSPEEISEVLVATAPVVSAFLAKLFGVEAQVGGVEGDIAREGVIFEFKREFVKKRTARRKRAEIEALTKAQRVRLDEAAREALQFATDAGGEQGRLRRARHAYADRIDEQHRHLAGETAQDLQIEMAAVVIPPVLAAHADDAVERPLVRLAFRHRITLRTCLPPQSLTHA